MTSIQKAMIAVIGLAAAWIFSPLLATAAPSSVFASLWGVDLDADPSSAAALPFVFVMITAPTGALAIVVAAVVFRFSGRARGRR